MALRDLVLSLIARIRDPTIRADISSTIYYLKDVYSTGRVSEEEILNSLFEVINDVLAFVQPELTEEERRERAVVLARQFLSAIKLETLRRRQLELMRGRLRRERL